MEPAMRLIGMLLLGGVIGWFARDLTLDKTKARAGRSAPRVADRGRPPDGVPPPRISAADETESGGTDLVVPAEEATPPKPAADAKEDPLAEMVRTMTKQWKAMSSMFAQQRGWKEQLLAAGFDAGTAEKIEKLISEEAARQIEKAMEMMLDSGVPLDADAFYWFMGVGPKLSVEAEKELSLFLSDDEIASVRREVEASHEKQLTGYADMTIGMMGIGDLSTDQKGQIRDVLAGKDFIKEQFVGFAQLTRNRKAFQHLMENPKEFGQAMKARMQPMRQRMQSILRPDQLQKYDLFEKQTVQMAQMQMKMMSSFIKKPGAPETKKPAGQ
jgi:hypothetical protein